jgi:hypothetical protein
VKGGITVAEHAALKRMSMAKVGSVCSIAGGLTFLASGAGFFLFQVGTFETLTMITGAIAVVVHPVWLIWTGIVPGRYRQ